MECRDRRGVDAGTRRGTTSAGLVGEVGIVGRARQFCPDAVAQLCGRGLGERDGHETGDIADGASRDGLHHTVDQDLRLARARAGFDEQVAVQVGTDALADVVIDGQRVGEQRHPSASST